MAKGKIQPQKDSNQEPIKEPEYPKPLFSVTEGGAFLSERDELLFFTWAIDAVQFCYKYSDYLKKTFSYRYDPDKAVENLKAEIENSNLPDLLCQEKKEHIEQTLITQRGFWPGFDDGVHNRKFEKIVLLPEHSDQLRDVVENYLRAISLTKQFKFLEEYERNKEESTKTPPLPFKKLKWTAEKNKLISIFYKLIQPGETGISDLDTTKENLIKFICSSFVDKEGEDFKKSSIETILKPGRNESRSKRPPKINGDLY